MKIRILFPVMLLLLTATVYAQRQKVVRQPVVTPEEQEQQEKLERMLSATERVMFIDSFVVSKKDFLRYYRLSADAGTIKRTADMLRNYRYKDSFAYLNELGTKRYLSCHETDSTSQLYSSDYENGMWTKPTLMVGINDEKQFTQINYPFVMGDGQTLYFAAKGDGGLGGYDIYMTTYDSEQGRYLHPISIGMPFNSEANDYMYAVDEYDSLGWFVTDRRQPEGMVCVYAFIPSAVRQTYSTSEFTPEDIARFARIDCISATWDDRRRLTAALQRLRFKATSSQLSAVSNQRTTFVINDRITYSGVTDFRAPGNQSRYQQLLTLRNKQQEVAQSLDKSRRYYATAPEQERRQLRGEIESNERHILQLSQQVCDIEKSIRNAENTYLLTTK